MDSLDDLCKRIMETNSRKTLDDSLKYNAENASGSGLEVRVTRIYDGVGVNHGKSDCQWCLDRCGENMTLEEAYRIGAFQRHPGCGCIIEYTSKKGEKTWQTGKSSPKNWLSEEEFNRRVNYGLNERKITPQERNINAAIEMQARDKYSNTLANAIIENHEALSNYTPEGMLRRLERAGFIVKPLSRGSLKGVPFEANGGYKINFGGDAIFQYHPSNNSHHKGAYWKIITGKVSHRYDMAGNEI